MSEATEVSTLGSFPARCLPTVGRSVPLTAETNAGGTYLRCV